MLHLSHTLVCWKGCFVLFSLSLSLYKLSDSACMCGRYMHVRMHAQYNCPCARVREEFSA